MKYSDLRDFIAKLKQSGELSEVSLPVSPVLEMTELCDRTLRAGGPALLFKNPTGHSIPVLGNLFGTPKRVALGMGASDVGELRRIGHLLSALKEPEPPKGLRDVLGLGSLVKSVWDMAPKELRSAPCQEIVWEGPDVDLSRLPIQHCWPGDIAPLITWGLVITKGPHKKRQNLGIYRQQVIGPNKLIMRSGCDIRAAMTATLDVLLVFEIPLQQLRSRGVLIATWRALRNLLGNLLCQLLTQFNTPLIKTVYAPHTTLHKHAVLIQRYQRTQSLC